MKVFSKIVVIALAGCLLLLAGCSANQSSGAVELDHSSVLDIWIDALNNENMGQFEQLHNDTVTYHSHNRMVPYNGSQDIWEAIRRSNPGQLTKLSVLGQDEIYCLQVTSSDPGQSLLYVFEFEQDLISHVYSYSAEYDLSDVPLFEGIEFTTADTGLTNRIGVIETQPDALNNRNFLEFLNTFNDDAILYVPPAELPVIGIDGIHNDVESFTQRYPTVELSEFRTIGQGNLVCQQLSVSNGPMRSLGFINVFVDDKVSIVYEYASRSQLSE